MAQSRVMAKVCRILGRGHCPMGSFQVGDEVDFFGEMASICHWAYNSLYPAACVLAYGGSLPWWSDPYSVELCCPDPFNPVVFELRRVTGEEDATAS